MRDAISTAGAPRAIGPYSQAIRAGNLLFLSGQIALEPSSGNLVPGGIAAETRQVLQNAGKILEAAGSSLHAVVRTTVYLADMNDFAAMNDVYGTFFAAPAPARSTIQVARLPREARVEIDVIALLP